MYWNVILLSSTLLVNPLAAQDQSVPTFDFAQSAKAGDKSGENSLYDAGRTAIDAEDWDTAVVKFDKAAKLDGPHAAESLYWEAYAYKKLRNRKDALTCLGELYKKYPKSKWVDDARALEIELRAINSGTRGGVDRGVPATAATPATPASPAYPATPAIPAIAATPDYDDDHSGMSDNDDLKLLALNQIMDNDPSRALPLIEKMLQSNSSTRLKEHALFVLAQTNDPKAYELVTRVAKGEFAPALQRKAIQQLGVAGRKEELEKIYRSASNSNVKVWVLDAYVVCGCTSCFNDAAKNETDPAARRKAIQGLAINGARQELRDLYKSAPDKETKKWILDSYVIDGDTEAYLEAAKNEPDPDLRKRAIQGLGVNGAKKELHELYKSSSDADTKRWILEAFIPAGDTEGFNEIALSEQNPELRKKAIQGIGINGGKRSGPTLVALYEKFPDFDTRRAVLDALFISGDSRDMIALFKKETDPKMKKEIVSKLSIMGGEDVREFMRSILDNE